MPRILILTASMGEGHNTAARNIRDALLAESGGNAEVLVADPYTRTNPVINKLMQKGYETAINRYPRAWKVVFELLSKRGVVEGDGAYAGRVDGRRQSAHRRVQSGHHRLDLSGLFLPHVKDSQEELVAHPAILHRHHRLHDDQFGLVSLPCNGSIVADETDRRRPAEGRCAARESPRAGLSGWPGLRVALARAFPRKG